MAHYYTKDGEPRHYVPMKTRPDELRPTRTTDAKKNGWVPSVTTILNVLDKAALVNWKVDQHIKQAYSLDPKQFDDYDLYLSKVKHLTKEEMDMAPSAGTDVHASLEQYFLGNTPETHIQICRSVDDLIMDITGLERDQFNPEAKFAHPLGFAGMVDLSNDKWVIDFKTKQTSDKFKPGKMAYPDHFRQLAAYRYGLGIPHAQCANIFICIESGELDFHLHKEGDLQKGWLTFKDSLSIWQRENFDTSYEQNK